MPKNIRFPATLAGLSAMAETNPATRPSKAVKAPAFAPKGNMQGKHTAPVTRRLEVPGKGRAR